MPSRIHIVIFLALLSSCKLSNAATQSLTILGGYGNQGELSQNTEFFDKVSGTWKQAYLTGGGHPWGNAPGTNSWINLNPSFFVGLNSTTDYRIRFYVPADFSAPTMAFNIKADNEAWLKLNGVELGHVVGGNTGAAGDALLKSAIKVGLNEITLTMADYGGWVGLNYRIDITMQSASPLVLQPPTAPMANAGADISSHVNETVLLDGSTSTAKAGKLLSYRWEFVSKPAGSSAVLNNATSVNPSFKIDKAGNYSVKLIVNDGTMDSIADEVKVSTLNTAPVAHAGPDQSARVNQTITLDGSQSSDVDGDLLTYAWVLSSKPVNSTASLSDVTAMNPTFKLDKSGDYLVNLTVNDGALTSIADSIKVSTVNSAPVADAGADKSARVNEPVTLDGTLSSDADGEVLTYKWTFTSKPEGSAAVLNDDTAVTPHFTLDKPGNYVLSLSVSDGQQSSVEDSVTVNSINSAPVANAGANQSGKVQDTITLDASSSSDVDGNLLTYAWAITSKPTDSSATLNDPTAVNPTFTIDKSGSYVVQLTVNDGHVDSAPATTTIDTINSLPVANAGIDQEVHEGSSVTLNGSASDVDGDLLTYKWAFSALPAGSTASIADPTALSTSFIADLDGTYVLQLTANDGQADSHPSSVTVTSTNLKPIAAAGDDQSLTLINSTVQLNGSQSYDPNGDNITYQWSILNKPSGSKSTLSSSTAVSPVFIADMNGTYIVQLIVKDQWGLESQPSNTTISFNNVAPLANAGMNLSGIVGNIVNLDGSGSSDANGDALTYAWSLTALPKRSNVQLVNANSPIASFTPDVEGTYQAQLIVNDGFVNSPASVVQIVEITFQTQTINDIRLCQSLVKELPASVFVNKNQQKTMTQKLNSVIEEVNEQEYRDALSSFKHDLVAKVDGCADSGKVDKNDWIKSCSVQAPVYACFQKELIDLSSLANTQPARKGEHSEGDDCEH